MTDISKEKQTKTSYFSARRLAELALFIAIMLVLDKTSLGYIPIGPISVTTMHIPVIVGAIYGGWRYGIILGLAFGLSSFLKAMQGGSGVLSFIFMNPAISILPRLMMGLLTGLVAEKLKDKNKIVAYGIPGALGSLFNTIFVMGSMYLIYLEAYAETLNITISQAAAGMLSVCVVNGGPEAIFAGLVAVPILSALKRKH